MKRIQTVCHFFQERTSSCQENILTKFKLSHFIKIYFDFAYYTGTCPFRIVKDKNTGIFHHKIWRIQQIICAILHITCAFRLVADVRNSLPPAEGDPDVISNYRHGPIQIFEMVAKIATMIYKLITIKRFWMNAHDYVNVANVADAYMSKFTSFFMHDDDEGSILNKYTISLLYGLPTFEAVCRFYVIGIGIPLGNSPSDFKWSPSEWLLQFVTYSRYMFRFIDDKDIAPYSSLCQVSPLDGIFGVLAAFSTFERTVLSFYCDLSVLASSLTLWVAAKAFSQEILLSVVPGNETTEAINLGFGSIDSPEIVTSTDEDGKNFVVTLVNNAKLDNNDQGGAAAGAAEESNKILHKRAWKKIYGRFKAIRLLSEAINKAVGSQVTLFMVEVIMHYSIYLNGWLRSKDFYWRITWTLFYLVTSSVLIISADVCNQMEAVKTWLTDKENIRLVPFQEAYLVLQQLSDKNIGVRGNSFFIVTYALLGTSLGLIITFFIIFLQSNHH